MPRSASSESPRATAAGNAAPQLGHELGDDVEHLLLDARRRGAMGGPDAASPPIVARIVRRPEQTAAKAPLPDAARKSATDRRGESCG